MILFFVIPDEQNEQMNLSSTLSEDLILRTAAGDTAAFESLYYQSYHAVYGYILSILKNQHDAEDIMQDTFIRIRDAAHLYKPSGKPLAWIFTIAKNLSFMKLRREKLYAYSSYDDLSNDLDFSTVENNEIKILLDAAFTILSDEERQIIIIHANTGMKFREIASLLALPLSTILSKYNRGLKKLKNYLEGGN